jgi:hypothetical protein
MKPAFDRIIAADDQTRLGLFTATALRLGTTPQNAGSERRSSFTCRIARACPAKDIRPNAWFPS